MDELLAAAGVVAMAIDDDGNDDLGVGSTLATVGAGEANKPASGKSAVGKENNGDLPGPRNFEAEVQEVSKRSRTSKFRPYAQPKAC